MMDWKSVLISRSMSLRALGVLLSLGLALGVAAAGLKDAAGQKSDGMQTPCSGPVIVGAFNLSWDPAQGCVVGSGGCDFSKYRIIDSDDGWAQDRLSAAFPKVAPPQAQQFMAAPPQAQQVRANADICRQFELSDSIFKPIWVETRDQILAFSPSARRVVGLLGNGKSAGTPYSDLEAFAFSRVGDEEFLRFRRFPSEERVPGVAVPEMEVVWLDRYLHEKGTFSLLDPSPDSEIRILSLMNWTVTKGNEAVGAYLVGYGAYTGNLQTLHQDNGFFVQELHRPETGKRGKSALIEVPFRHEHYYLLEAAQYFTSIGSIAYFLKMEPGKPPELYRFDTATNDPEPAKVANLPGGDRALPDLGPDVRGPADYLKIRQPILDSTDLIRGIYSQGESLYTLSRHPQEGWQLSQLQVVPTKDAGDARYVVKRLATMPIPSDARAISLLPTKDRWFVFEHHYGEQVASSSSMLVVPTDVVKSSRRSPLYGPGAKRIRCAAQ